ncbi:hypothetical protein ACHAXH_001399 [Discostella pseudostelligera]
MRLRSAFAYRRRLLLQKQRSNSHSVAWNSWRDTGDNNSDSDSDDDDDEDEAFSSSSSSSGDIESLNNDEDNNQQSDIHSPRRHNTNANMKMIVVTSPASSPSKPCTREGKNDDKPPTPWGKSTAKMRIIDELSDPTSDIHLHIGQYTATNFENVNFKALLQIYADNKYKPGNFRENTKHLLMHLHNKTGPFKEIADGHQKNKVEKWYTSVNNVSKAYSLLFSLLMNDAASTSLSRLTVEEIWKSDPHFQQYELEKFKEYYKNMVKRTNKRKQLIRDEYRAYHDDMLKLPRSNITTRDYPFWNTHRASELLEDDEESGKAKELKPKELWASRKEYQEFPLCVFRKHIYQLRSKRLAAPFWQYKRNMNAKKKYEDVESMMKEWHNSRCNEMIGDFDKISFQETKRRVASN